MLKLVTLATAVAGCASLCGAQDFSLVLVPEPVLPECPDGSFTVSVYGDSSFGTHLLGGAFGLEIGDGSEFITDITWTNAAWSAFNTDGGYAGNGVHNQVIFGQLVIPDIFPPAPGSENGELIGSFEVEYAFAGPVFMEFQLTAGSPFSLETVDSVTGQTYQDNGSNISLGSASILVCPSPGCGVLLGLAGIAATKRRRS